MPNIWPAAVHVPLCLGLLRIHVSFCAAVRLVELACPLVLILPCLLACMQGADIQTVSSRPHTPNAYEWTAVKLCCICAEAFSQPGLGGREAQIKDLGWWGANPSVTWNSYLQRWLMVWHEWGPGVILSSSTDLVHWAPGVRIVLVSCQSVARSERFRDGAVPPRPLLFICCQQERQAICLSVCPFVWAKRM